MPFGMIGDIVGSGITSVGNAHQAAKNREWQAQQSNTAHQRQVADMRRAGLNPILSGQGGSGASTGSGAQASMADMGSIGSRAVSSAKTRSDYSIDKPRRKMSDRINKFLDTKAGRALVPASAAQALGLGKEAQALVTAADAAQKLPEGYKKGYDRPKAIGAAITASGQTAFEKQKIAEWEKKTGRKYVPKNMKTGARYQGAR